MKNNDGCGFIIICVLSGLFIAFLLANKWFFKIAGIELDDYSILLVFSLIGIALLPFVKKLKIGNVLELERLTKEINEVKNRQYIGEVIRGTRDGLYYYDSEGKHIIPDKETAVFFRSNKGEIIVPQNEVDAMQTSYPIDSVLTARIVDWKGHIFVILNDKKYHVSSASFLADWNKPMPYEKISDEQINKFSMGR